MKQRSKIPSPNDLKIKFSHKGKTYSNPEKGWRQRQYKDVQVHFCGNFIESYFRSLVNTLTKREKIDYAKLENQLKSMPDVSGIIIEGSNFVFAATNKIRAKPILYTKNKQVFVSTCPFYLWSKAEKKVCDSSCFAIFMSGYTIGNKTICKDIYQLCAGQYLYSQDESLHVSSYNQYFDCAPPDIELNQSVKKLKSVTLGIFEELRDKLDGAPILIPLSAGYDSRLVISALTMLGTQNISSFSYGYQDGFEVSTARQIASHLQVPWTMLKPHSSVKTKFLRSEEFDSYLNYIDTFSNAPFIQDIHHLWELKQTQGLEEGTYIINGNTGDFISGNHIPLDFNEQTDDEKIITSITEKHFKLWEGLEDTQAFKKIKQDIASELELYKAQNDFLKDKHAFAQYETFEFMHRQTKFLISGQQAYDFLGLNWELPLWHEEYIDFWTKTPLQLKINQHLYRYFLISENWMGVWGKTPINSKNIRPKWIIGPRLAAKIFFAFSGKENWHRFERRFFQYFMDLTGTYRRFKYSKIYSDNRRARNQLAFLAEEYLADKGISI